MLIWSNKKTGELIHDGRIADIYEGNCLFIMRYRANEEGTQYYGTPVFFNDDNHMKRCLGLTMGCYDYFDGNDVKLILYRSKWSKADFRKVVTAFAQRKGNTTIEIKEVELMVDEEEMSNENP